MIESNTTVTATETLDCTGLLCPLPVYKAGVVLNRLQPGDILELVTTDPGALEDVPAMTRQRGDVLLSAGQAGETQRFRIQKGGTR